MATRKNITIQEAKNEYNEQVLNKKRFRFSEFPELHTSFLPEEINNATECSTPRRPTFSSATKKNLQTTFTPTIKRTQHSTPPTYSQEHKNALISPNGSYNLNPKSPFMTNPDNTLDNSLVQTQSVNTISLLDDEYIINENYTLPHQDILEFLMYNPNFNLIIKQLIQSTNTNDKIHIQ